MTRRVAKAAALIVLYLAVYDVAARAVGDPYKLPGLARLLAAARSQIGAGTMLIDSAISMGRIVAGLVAGVVGAMLAVALVSTHPIVRVVVEPALRLLRAIPAIALVPVAILMVGLNFSAQVLIIALASMLPMWITFQEASDAWSREYGSLTKTLRLSARERWIRVQLPLIGSSVARAMRIGAGIACYALVASELLGADAGLMYRANISYEAGKMADMYVSLVALALLCLLIDLGINTLRAVTRPVDVQGGM